MQLITVKVEKPDDTNFILGQTHFIKSVEDIHEALVTAVPGIKYGRGSERSASATLLRPPPPCNSWVTAATSDRLPGGQTDTLPPGTLRVTVASRQNPYTLS